MLLQTAVFKFNNGIHVSCSMYILMPQGKGLRNQMTNLPSNVDFLLLQADYLCCHLPIYSPSSAGTFFYLVHCSSNNVPDKVRV